MVEVGVDVAGRIVGPSQVQVEGVVLNMVNMDRAPFIKSICYKDGFFFKYPPSVELILELAIAQAGSSTNDETQLLANIQTKT